MRKWLLILVLLALLVPATHALAADGDPDNEAGKNSLVRFGENITVGPQEVVNGDVAAMGGSIFVEGRVQGSVFAMGGNIEIRGVVHKDAVSFGGNVTARDGASIGGGLTSVGGQVRKDPGATVGGSIVETRGPGSGSMLSNPGFPLGAIFGWPLFGGYFNSALFNLSRQFLVLIGLLAFGAIAVAIAPRQVTTVRSTLVRAPWPIVGIGLLTPIVLIVLTILLAITVVGIPAAVLLWAIALPIGGLLGFTAIAVLIGERLLAAANARQQTMLLTMAVGVVLIRVVTMLPIIGGIIFALLGLFGLAAVILTIYGVWTRRRNGRRTQGAPPPGPAPAG